MSSALPSVAPNNNTGLSLWDEKDSIVATQTVYPSKKFPSCVLLPEMTNPKFVDAWTDGNQRTGLHNHDLITCIRAKRNELQWNSA
jgi:hypothetical protein